MELKYGFISADDHVQEHPEVWTKRMSKAKWGERIPHVRRAHAFDAGPSVGKTAMISESYFPIPVAR